MRQLHQNFDALVWWSTALRSIKAVELYWTAEGSELYDDISTIILREVISGLLQFDVVGEAYPERLCMVVVVVCFLVALTTTLVLGFCFRFRFSCALADMLSFLLAVGSVRGICW